MDGAAFYEMVPDNLTHGIYVLDDKGNYLFVNSAYVQMLNMPKTLLLSSNVYDFYTTKQVNVSIADIVYKEKRRVVMYQDIFDTQHYGRKNFRVLVESIPIFNREGNIQNIISMVRSTDEIDALYDEANKQEVISRMVYSGVNQGDDSFIAASAAMHEVLAMASIVAPVDSAVLISGESGTGKEVVAQYIHQKGPRKERSMVIINCASLPPNLLEAELFGYEKGAFTGALPGGKKGLIEEANKSTLFLDEINSLPCDLQGKLLRAIETKTIQRIGAAKSTQVDFRLLAATNEDLEALTEEKKFRADLYYRLNVIPIIVPPIRERKDDIIPLANHFLYYFCKKHNKRKVFTKSTLEKMMEYNWPGNVRQLKNFVERSVVVSVGDEIEIADIENVIGGQKGPALYTAFAAPKAQSLSGGAPFSRMLEEGISLGDYLEQCERGYVTYALEKYNNTYKAAEALKDFYDAVSYCDADQATKESYMENNFARAGYVAADIMVRGLQRLEDSGLDYSWENFIACMEADTFKLITGGTLDYSDGCRLGATQECLLEYYTVTKDDGTVAIKNRVLRTFEVLEDVLAR